MMSPEQLKVSSLMSLRSVTPLIAHPPSCQPRGHGEAADGSRVLSRVRDSAIPYSNINWSSLITCSHTIA